MLATDTPTTDELNCKKSWREIFISHGTSDQVMPIDITSRRFIPNVKSLGYDVTYREHDGRHQLPPDIARQACEWFTST